MVEDEREPTLATRKEFYPAVSVQICTYGDRSAFLRKALESVLSQTYDDFEVVVVGDGPLSEASLAVLTEFTNRFYDRGVLLLSMATEEPSGYYTIPRNYSTGYCRGDYIAPLDDDNEFTPEHLAVLVGAIEDGPIWPDLVYGRRDYIIDEDAPKHIAWMPGPSGFVPWDEAAKERLGVAMDNFIDASDILMAKGALYWLALTTQSMWNEAYRRFGDWELVCRAAYFGGWRFKGVDAILQRYHVHGSNISHQRSLQETPLEKNVTREDHGLT